MAIGQHPWFTATKFINDPEYIIFVECCNGTFLTVHLTQGR